MLKGKKLLVLGGKPVGSYDIVRYAKSQGVYTIVTDYLPKEKSIAKQIADECWDISTADVGTIIELIKKNNIDGVFTGVHEFNIAKTMEICKRIGLPFYSTAEQWAIGTDKALFKKLCHKYGLPVAKDYLLSDFDNDSLNFPVIVKPVDGSSGKGISICDNTQELRTAYEVALSESNKKQVIIEDYIVGNEIVAFYTIKNGVIKLSALSDYYYNYDQKITMPLPQVYIYPSKFINEYIEQVNSKAISMLKALDIQNGTFFLQAFFNENGFFFFEPGYRLGGSSVHKYTSYLNSISCLEMLVDYSLTGKMDNHNINLENPFFKKPCCTLSLVSKGGTVGNIVGFNEVINLNTVIDYEKRYDIGDHINEMSALGQIHLRFFIVGNSLLDISKTINYIQDTVKVYDINGLDMLIAKFDTNRLGI
jgi:carbamoylphosphate synthase large subunit